MCSDCEPYPPTSNTAGVCDTVVEGTIRFETHSNTFCECQKLCRNKPVCHYFSWGPANEAGETCFLHSIGGSGTYRYVPTNYDEFWNCYDNIPRNITIDSKI